MRWCAECKESLDAREDEDFCCWCGGTLLTKPEMEARFPGECFEDD